MPFKAADPPPVSFGVFGRTLAPGKFKKCFTIFFETPFLGSPEIPPGVLLAKPLDEPGGGWVPAGPPPPSRGPKRSQKWSQKNYLFGRQFFEPQPDILPFGPGVEGCRTSRTHQAEM